MDNRKWFIIKEMERRREIMSYYAGLRAAIIGRQLPRIIVTFDENRNVTRFEKKYSPDVEYMLHFLDEQEKMTLENVKSVNYLGL